MVPFKSCFMQDPEIHNFYLGNLETHPFFEDLDGPVGLQGSIESKIWIKQIVLGIRFCRGVPSIQKTRIWLKIFTNLRVRQIKKLHKTKSDRRPILGESLLQKMWEFQNFGRPPGQPRLLAPWAKTQNFAPNILFASLSRFRKGVTRPPAPKPPEEIDSAETPFFGVRAWPEGLGVRVTHPKITCEEFSRAVSTSSLREGLVIIVFLWEFYKI